MKLKDLVKNIQATGLKVTYRVRSDGGIVITSINGVKYKGKEGNKQARALTNTPVSIKQQTHLKRASKKAVKRRKEVSEATRKGLSIPPKPKKAKTKEPTLTKAQRRKLRDVQKEYRKLDPSVRRKRGKPSAKKLKEMLKTHTKAEADQALKEAKRYAQGLISSGQVDFLITRIRDLAYENGDDPTSIINKIKRHKNKFKEDHFLLFKEELYKYEDGKIAISTLEARLTAILKTEGQDLKTSAQYHEIDPFDL